RHRQVDRPTRRAADGFELARRRASVAGDGVAVVALLVRPVPTLLDDAVAAAGLLAAGGAVRVVGDQVAVRVLPGVALLDTCLDVPVAACRLRALLRTGGRRPVGSAVVTALARIQFPVAAELSLLLRGEPVGGRCQVVTGLRGARENAARKRGAAA